MPFAAVELIKWIGLACCIALSLLFVWLFRERNGEPVTLVEVYARQAEAQQTRAEELLREALAYRDARFEEDVIEPLPTYSLYGAGEDVHLDLADRLAIIVEQLESGGIVVSATQPVLASNPASGTASPAVAPGSPRIAPSPTHHHHHHHRRSSSPTEDAQPVRLMLSLPPPPKYDPDAQVGVQIEVGAEHDPSCPASIAEDLTAAGASCTCPAGPAAVAAAAKKASRGRDEDPGTPPGAPRAPPTTPSSSPIALQPMQRVAAYRAGDAVVAPATLVEEQDLVDELPPLPPAAM